MKRNIALIGDSSVIKTELGIALSLALHMLCLDCDEFLQYEMSLSIDEILRRTNKTYFKQQVKRLTDKLVDYENTVFVSSDRVELTEAELKTMKKNCHIIFLKAFDNAKYEKWCDLVVDIKDKTIAQLIAAVTSVT